MSVPEPGSSTLGTLTEAAELLTRIETSIPVDEWRAGSVEIWPVVRMRLGYALQAAAAGRAPPTHTASLVEVGRRTAHAARGLATAVGPRTRRDTPGDASSARRPVALFLGDARTVRYEGSVAVHRPCDALRGVLADAGSDVPLLLGGYERASGLRGPVERVQSALDAAAARGRFGRSPVVVAPGWHDADAMLRDAGIGSALPAHRTLGHAGGVVDRMAGVFERRIAQHSAVAGFMSEYYALRSMAFTLACRRRRIPSVDLQHGVQGELHFAYGGLTTPPQGWDLLPDWFWVWGSDDAAVIERWAGETRHGAVVGGNGDLARWLDPLDRPAAAYADGLLSGLVDPAASMHVLLTLSGVETAAEIALLTATIRSAPPTWRWWMRGHPLRPGPPAWLGSIRSDRFDPAVAAAVTRAPLYPLLRRADVHVTGASSVVLDAQVFGVHSVIVEAGGREQYADVIAEGGAAGPRGTADAVIAAIAAAPPPDRSSAAAADARAHLEAGSRWARALVGLTDPP